MVNLFEIARSGSGLEALSRQMALDPALTRRAVEALLPAFTLALQHSLLDPSSFARLAHAVGSGRYAPFYEAPTGPGAGASGEGLLGLLFRDPDAPRQVATQAAAATGIGAQVLVEMLPLLAGMLIGGLSRYATAEGFSGLLDTWSNALATASRGYEATARPRPEPTTQPWPSDPWSAWMALATSFAGRPAPPEPPRPAPTVFDAWTAGLLGAPTPAPKPEPVANPFAALSQMFETGREVQAQYLENLRTVLDAAWKGGKPS